MVDLSKIADATRTMVERGETIFQAYRFGDSDIHHLWRLLCWAELPEYCNLIDMGCGLGTVTHVWQQIRPDIRTTLVNISPEQMAYINHPRKHICDMTAVPEPDHEFDAAICLFAIGHVDKAQALKEMARLVKPGGIVFIFDMIGGNDRIKELDYSIGSHEEMKQESEKHGLKLDIFLIPQPRNDYGEKILGKDFETYFFQCTPAIWRFIKC